jgi:single-strand DNA-binding protein
MAQRSLNKVMLLGNLGRDPEVRYTAAGKAVATFTLATSMRWKDQEGADQEKTEWHRIVAWGRLGEICGEYLSKGKSVFIEGRIQSREWEDKDGNRRTTVEIVATDMIMLSSGQAGSPGRAPDDGHGRTKPSQPAAKKGGGQPRTYDEGQYGPLPPDDEIPF